MVTRKALLWVTPMGSKRASMTVRSKVFAMAPQMGWPTAVPMALRRESLTALQKALTTALQKALTTELTRGLKRG